MVIDFGIEFAFKDREKIAVNAGEKQSLTPGIAGGCRRLFSMIFVHILGDALVDGHIFFRQIIVIVIIPIKILQLCLIHGNGKMQYILFRVKLVLGTGKLERYRYLNRGDRLYDKPGGILIKVMLFNGPFRLQDIHIIQYGQNLRHTFQIFFVVKEKKLIQVIIFRGEILFIKFDQLSAVELIKAVQAKEGFDGFLF